MSITEYCRKIALMSKLRAAIESIEVGNGYSVFEGLQEDGSVIVKLVVDGETVHFESLLPKDTIFEPQRNKVFAESPSPVIEETPKVTSVELATPFEVAEEPKTQKEVEDEKLSEEAEETE